MADFSQYAGPSEEWLAVEKTLPALTFDTTQDLSVLKKTANEGREQVAAQDMQTLAPQLTISDHTIPTRDGSAIEARSYRPISKGKDEKLPVYLFFHGGGYLFGTVTSDDAACARVAINTGVVVLNANYRHTPEFTYPTAWNDAQDAFAWLHKNTATLGVDPSKVVVGGISAGGQLTASLVLEKHLGKSDALKGLPDIAGQILIIPCLAHPETYASGPAKRLKSPNLSSYVENENAPVLPKKVVDFFMSLLKAGAPEYKDTKLNIVNFEENEVKGMPPAVFGIAGLDPLRDEALLYAQTLTKAGVPTEVRLFKGVPHGFRRFGAALKASEHWDKCVEEGILWALEKPSATGKFEVKLP